MLTNLLSFVAFVAFAYLTTCLSATRSPVERVPARVRSDASDVKPRH